MIKLHVNPIVLSQLCLAFPSPAGSAQKQLNKYVATLEAFLNRAVLWKDGHHAAFKWYSISTHRLSQQGGSIGSEPQIRIHKWLNDNNLSLIKPFIPGDALTGRVSKVLLSDLVEVDDLVQSVMKTPESLDELVKRFMIMCPEVFIKAYLTDLYDDLSDNKNIGMLYDTFPVDSKSLERFIAWIPNTTGFSHAKKYHHLTNALIIKISSELCEGVFYQKKKPSVFGRTYYSGVSIQNIHKTLRKAVLGKCCEYDIESSVMAFKMGFAAECYASLKSKDKIRTLDDTFKCTISLINDKKRTREDIRQEVFGDDFPLSLDEQMDCVKTALTAIGFGAKARLQGWYVSDNDLQRPAINEIFKDIDCRRRFVESSFVKALMVEQSLLDKVIYENTIATNRHLLTQSEFLNSKGKPIKNKVLSFAYQTGETKVMNEFRRLAIEWNSVVIANVHDAVFLERKLIPSRRSYIQETIRLDFNNPYWTFDEKEMTGFVLSSAEKEKLEQAEIDFWNEQDERLQSQRRSGELPSFFGEQMEVIGDVFTPPESHPSKSYKRGICVQNASPIP
jgi:hypothetical protein